MSNVDDFPDLPTISDILSEIELADGSNLDQKQVKKLKNLKKSDKSPVFRVEYTDLIINTIATIDKLGFDETFRYLKEVSDEDYFQIVKNSPIYTRVRKNNFIELTEDIVIKKVTGFIKCKECGSKDVEYKVVQQRSSDEGASELYKCNSCGHRWRIG